MREQRGLLCARPNAVKEIPIDRLRIRAGEASIRIARSIASVCISFKPGAGAGVGVRMAIFQAATRRREAGRRSPTRIVQYRLEGDGRIFASALRKASVRLCGQSMMSDPAQRFDGSSSSSSTGFGWRAADSDDRVGQTMVVGRSSWSISSP